MNRDVKENKTDLDMWVHYREIHQHFISLYLLTCIHTSDINIIKFVVSFQKQIKIAFMLHVAIGFQKFTLPSWKKLTFSWTYGRWYFLKTPHNDMCIIRETKFHFQEFWAEPVLSCKLLALHPPLTLHHAPSCLVEERSHIPGYNHTHFLQDIRTMWRTIIITD